MSLELDIHWTNATFVALDLETTGAYPVGDHICEIGAVKWRNGEVTDRFQTLIKPPVIMSDFIIGIHNITNEMVADAPKIEDKIAEFHNFIQNAFLVAHHSPFDIGFLAHEFEKAKLPFPKNRVFCSSLFARKAVTGTPNHKLQTLIKHFKIDGGQAHRAQDDAQACLEVLIRCFESFDAVKTVQQLLDYQKTNLSWSQFSLEALELKQSFYSIIYNGIRKNEVIELYYAGGSKPGKSRLVLPLGVVRNPSGDYLVAYEMTNGEKSENSKRYYLRKIQDAGVINTP